jgi:hypothetical protein
VTVGEERIAIRPMVAEDAAALSDCFRRCYGESYVVADFYDPAATAARVRSGTLRSVVAVAESGEIVGHMGLTIRHPRARTVDAGNSIVDPRHRGRQIVQQLGLGVIELGREGGFLGFHHYPTTVHPIMQKLAVAGGGVESGIMLEYIPSGTEYREIEGAPRADRPAVVVVYQALAPGPSREVFVPEHLAALVEEIYVRGRLPRTLRRSVSALPTAATRLHTAIDRRRGLVRVTVEQIGGDLRDRVAAEIGARDAAVVHVDLEMAAPETPAAVSALGELGLFFSAVLPEYLDGDVLRLQRTAASPRPELVTDDARRLLAAIEADRARTRA